MDHEYKTQDVMLEVSFAPSKKNKKLVNILKTVLPKLSKFTVVQKTTANIFRKAILEDTNEKIKNHILTPGVAYDRRDIAFALIDTVERAFAQDTLSPNTINHLINVLVGEAMINKGDHIAREQFFKRYGQIPPSFLVISPAKSCNLHCSGCYAASDHEVINLSWPIFEKLVTEVRDLWGGRFMVISGGEPLCYRDQGKDLLDMAEAHPEMFFMFYTNGTLITDDIAERMGQLGNIMPAISVEGLQKETNEHRGDGVFEKILIAMDNLRRHKVLFGISITVTKNNADIFLSDEIMDFYFLESRI